jgi:uncharacterized membrane protein
LSPLRLLFLVAVAGFLATFVQLGLLRIAFDKLGLAPESAGLLFGTTIVGSLFNLPLFSLKTDAVAQGEALKRIPRILLAQRLIVPGKTIIAVNVGGCVVPVWFSVYLFIHNPVDPLKMLFAIVAVTVVAYRGSFSVAGVGIMMPIFIAPIVAALVGVMLDPIQPAVLAYIGGTLGVLIGADMLRLKDIRKLGEPVASIGGAGSFDGIFLTGIIAVLIA